MTTYGNGLEYDGALDILAHASTSAPAGVYENVRKLQIDGFGHVVDVEAGSVGSGYIDGLGFTYNGPHEIIVEPGAAFVPGLNRVVTLAAPASVVVPSTINQQFNLYLQEVNNTGAVFADTTDTSDAYFAAARTKLGDQFTRYVGMVKNDQLGNVIQQHALAYGSVLQVVFGVTQDSQSIAGFDSVTVTTTLQSRSIGPTAPDAFQRVVPKSCRVADVFLQRSGSGTIQLGWPIDALWARPPVSFDSTAAALHAGSMLLGPAQEVYYKSTSGSPGLYLFVLNYIDRR
jgi:hypothetical protein